MAELKGLRMRTFLDREQSTRKKPGFGSVSRLVCPVHTVREPTKHSVVTVLNLQSPRTAPLIWVVNVTISLPLCDLVAQSTFIDRFGLKQPSRILPILF